MIWHLFEVWASLVAAFVIGCTMGALIYDLVARTSFATGQGAIADSVGDVVDRIKDRLGVGPVWRPHYRRIVEAMEAEAGEEAAHVALGGAVMASEGDVPPGWEGGPADDEEAEWPDEEESIDAHAGAAEPLAGPVIAGEAAAASHAEAAVAASDGIVPMRPASLAEPRNGVPDNLQRIRGIGERNEVRLNKLGIFHFGQIAAWTPAEMRWVAQQLPFPERIERDDWVGQAIILATGGDTGFTKSAERRRARRQQELFQAEPGGEETDDQA